MRWVAMVYLVDTMMYFYGHLGGWAQSSDAFFCLIISVYSMDNDFLASQIIESRTITVRDYFMQWVPI